VRPGLQPVAAVVGRARQRHISVQASNSR
jgi:hypothetical protein